MHQMYAESNVTSCICHGLGICMLLSLFIEPCSVVVFCYIHNYTILVELCIIIFFLAELAIRPSLESILIPAHVSKASSSASPPTVSSGPPSQDRVSGSQSGEDSTTLLSKPGPSELSH